MTSIQLIASIPLIARPSPLFDLQTKDGTVPINDLHEIDKVEEGLPKKFYLEYTVLETRYVTVNAKTLEEAHKKATKEVKRRVARNLVRPMADGLFRIVKIGVLTKGKSFSIPHKLYGTGNRDLFPSWKETGTAQIWRKAGFFTIPTPIDNVQ